MVVFDEPEVRSVVLYLATFKERRQMNSLAVKFGSSEENNFLAFNYRRTEQHFSPSGRDDQSLDAGAGRYELS